MIAYLKGTVTEVEKDSVILECRDIGYRVFMPASSLERIGKTGEERVIHTYLNVREDAMQLYGFLTKNDLSAFRLLLGVSGIGPKAAMGILSHFSWEDLSFAVLSDDAASIAKAPGIGKKTAQKVILELKDKLCLQEAFEEKLSSSEASQSGKESGAAQEAVEAMVALGYGRSESLKAVRQAAAEEDMDVESLLRAALKQMI
ncbi:MAG: Holliday junction branch migration protein RuvA [Lachnospiraceae bacterium]|nr:Holliday junction branch migration protein RuvA [Lachnospiraceae bacterium]MCI9546023.1 Holliday junction branch migration protein RuvA [Lachnospiraceae bacterium]